ncbi:hypothetical protein ACIBCO_38270 [Streptomyces violascens]|uniref:hypothetical protein n=1 Tax=Streptomyces violascens TaxID=67381 RepID=UPI0037BC5897
MDIALFGMGAALTLCALVAAWTGRLTERPCYALLTLSFLLMLIGDLHQGNAPSAIVNAALTAYFAWRWWKNGGGDDTKRRLRGLARRVTPVRRTAPTTA